MKVFIPASVMAVLAFGVLILTSCQKEVSDFIVSPTGADSIYIDKTIGLDTTLTPGTDTVEKTTLVYDSQKRLSRSTQLYGTAWAGSTITDFLYTGNDSLPYKFISKEIYTGIWDYTDTVYLTYSNGFIIKDSTINHDNTNNVVGARVIQYTISGTTVNKVLKYYNQVGGNYVLQSSSSCVLTVGFTGPNITGHTLVSGASTFETVQVTYDAKHNPMGEAFKFRYPEADTPQWASWWVQRNNPLQVQFKEMGGPPDTETFTYTYRTDGYPTKALYHRASGNTGYNKILFFYKAL